jgi:hypothetical protein
VGADQHDDTRKEAAEQGDLVTERALIQFATP